MVVENLVKEYSQANTLNLDFSMGQFPFLLRHKGAV